MANIQPQDQSVYSLILWLYISHCYLNLIYYGNNEFASLQPPLDVSLGVFDLKEVGVIAS